MVIFITGHVQSEKSWDVLQVYPIEYTHPLNAFHIMKQQWGIPLTKDQ